MTDIVYTLDLDQRCTQLFGSGADREPFELAVHLGRTPDEIYGPERAALHRASNAAALGGESVTYDWELPAGDTLRYFTSTVAPLRDRHGLVIGVLGLTRDVTAQRSQDAAVAATQEQYRQAQKLEAVGQLAGGVAHDFNNLLTVVIAYADMLLADRAEDDDERSALEEIKYAAERGANLTRQLLTFSRQQVLRPRLVDLNDVVSRTERMLARTIDSSILLRVRLAPSEAPVVADVGQLEHLLLNLAMNARDAMPAGGTMTITTANRELDASDVQPLAGIAPGSYVELVIADDGAGMTEETLARVFEPFFTTKAIGKGTGLGMSTAHGIVQQSGGDIVVTSEVGRGTTCRMLFPRAGANSAERPRIDEPAGELTGEVQAIAGAPVSRRAGAQTTATILLVDDDDAIRNVVARLLGRAGHTVISASSAAEALRLLENDARNVELVLSDMVMPGMSGRELAYEVRVRFPHAAIVLMSGYTKDRVLEDDVLGAEVNFLHKPFTTERLYWTVDEALGAVRDRLPEATPEAVPLAVPEGRRALDAIMNGVDAVVWEAGAQSGTFHYVSRRAESLVGYPLARWRDRGFFESILHADDRARVLAMRREAIASATAFSDEYRVQHAAGGTIWLRDIVQVVTETQGNVTQLRGIMIDVTGRKGGEEALREAAQTVERQREFLAVVLDNLSEAVVACDENAMLTLFNTATRELHGLPAVPIDASEWAEHYQLYHGDGVTPMRMEDIPLYRALKGEDVHNVELFVVPKAGPARALLASGRRFADSAGNVLGAVVAMRDVTEIKKTERELIAAKEVAERANRTKSHFLSLISHELRTPLTAVIGFAKVLRKNRRGHLAADDLQYVDRIAANGGVLLQLVNDLLELTQIESEVEPNLTPVDLAAVVQEVTQSFHARAVAASLELRCEADPGIGLVSSDPVRLRSVLAKLLDNALKFTASGSIEVRVLATADGGAGPRIEVVDTGKGIAPEQLETIFAPFQQGEEFSSRQHGGSGLGLHLARRQCRMMHCRLSVLSEVGVGTKFILAFGA